jgi:hypothetical protein
MKIAPPIEDETLMSELTIMPDGRVFAFGTSRQLLEILHELDPRDANLNRVLDRVSELEKARPTEEIESHGR